MARELKTVHIDNDATFVKLLLHQCYVNERNLYSQVGVMAINLLGESLEQPAQRDELPSQSTGEVLSGAPAAMRSVPKPSAGASEDLSFDLRFDAKTAARIREIQVAKDHAVAMEDYDQAKRLKQMEEQLKSIGLQLARLEAQKRDAVANEDYDAAKRIKDEISLLEASVGSNETQPIVVAHGASTNAYSSPSPTYSTGSGTGNGRSMSRSQVLPRAAAAIVGTKSSSAASSSFSPRDMYPDEPPAPKQQSMRATGGFPGDRSPQHPSNSRFGQGPSPDDDYNDDTDGDPASGGPNPHFRGIPEAESLPDPDEIPAALAKENEQLIQVIGLFFTRCLYSNLWNHRDAAIRKVTMDLDRYNVEPRELLDVCSTLVQSGAGDRIAQVALSAFRLLERMLPLAAKVRKDDLCHIVRLSSWL